MQKGKTKREREKERESEYFTGDTSLDINSPERKRERERERERERTIDMIFTARQLQEKCQEQNVDLYMTFVDQKTEPLPYKLS